MPWGEVGWGGEVIGEEGEGGLEFIHKLAAATMDQPFYHQQDGIDHGIDPNWPPQPSDPTILPPPAGWYCSW